MIMVVKIIMFSARDLKETETVAEAALESVEKPSLLSELWRIAGNTT